MTITPSHLPYRGAIGTALLFALTACSKPAIPPTPPARVAWFTAAPAAADKAGFTGVVHARTETKLGFRVAGKVIARLIDPGDTVCKRQALMKRDPTDYVLASSAVLAAVEAAPACQSQAVADAKRWYSFLKLHWR
jgi:multidrug efflux pump subunit AcrA (membrane-fusion protein)